MQTSNFCSGKCFIKYVISEAEFLLGFLFCFALPLVFSSISVVTYEDAKVNSIFLTSTPVIAHLEFICTRGHKIMLTASVGDTLIK